MSFICGLCGGYIQQEEPADLPCDCLICMNCARKQLELQIQGQHSGAAGLLNSPPLLQPQVSTQYALGETVLYRDKKGIYVEAVVEIIDITVIPPQYGIQLPGRDDLRFTEEDRLCSTSAQPLPKPGGKPLQHLSAHCPRCKVAVGLGQLRRLVPAAVTAWEDECTAAWLRVNDIIICPSPGCGAYIQRVPAGNPGSDGSSPFRRRGHGGAQHPGSGAPATAEAAYHRQQHRFRCGACNGNFCDACLAVPYHDGFTCSQARAPDCLLCGDKVNGNRIEELLPEAAAIMAEQVKAGCGVQQHRSGREGMGHARDDDEGTLTARAVMQRASLPELLRALKNKLEVDTTWCLERDDLEKAILHWGCRTCGSPGCTVRRREMCGRPLPCGHWCCGLRGEGEAASGFTQLESQAHPCCVECGRDPRDGCSPQDGDTVHGAAKDAAALLRECCFCWEPLRTAPCIELACGLRHLCHLHCALERLAVGYPGPHISFAHLYCPLCRKGPNGGESARAAAGRNPGGSSVLQVALAPVHLDHPALRRALEPHLALRSEVVAAARSRIKMDPMLRADPELQPGGRYDGRPADFGMERLMFYKCSKCVKVYYGGQRTCGAAVQEERQPARQNDAAAPVEESGAGNDQLLLCGECCALAAGTDCPRHGTSYIEWKCRYCCSLATWFCFGTTHMCESCHKDFPRNLTMMKNTAATGAICKDPNCGLKGIVHPPPGVEACLGCSMCRIRL
ncbi:hypothetical protein VaNZ11_012227 [Volvox africanus]|uniref:IBR domain-containing protein n=1 Tax=Volvox africanus TaxID=51714 RepID=A0ABQ5SD93_9CHLO|nr:hypothetical protein VaNZ11_012227 [Volvox africanus]